MEDNISIVELLRKEKPMFHLENETKDMANVEKILFKRGKIDTSRFIRTSYPVGDDVLNYMLSIVNSHHVTLETGGGYSRIIFAAKSKSIFVLIQMLHKHAHKRLVTKQWLLQ